MFMYEQHELGLRNLFSSYTGIILMDLPYLALLERAITHMQLTGIHFPYETM
jgi:hypothetical protein